jgi:hypothetical protein
MPINNTFTIDSLSAYDSLLKQKNKNVLQQDLKSIKKHIDYSDFNNWVQFGSSQLEVNSAIVDIVQDYPDYEEYFNDDTEYIINENGEWSGFFDNNQIEWTIDSITSEAADHHAYFWDDAYVLTNVYGIGSNTIETEVDNPFSLLGAGAYSWRSKNTNNGVNFHIYYPHYNDVSTKQTIDHTDKDAFYRYTVFVKSNFDYDPGSITAAPGFHFKTHHYNKQYNALMKNYSTETYITPSDTYGGHNQSFFKYVNFSNLEHDSMSSLSAHRWYLFVGYYCPRGYDFSDKSVSSCIYDVAEKYKFGDIHGIDIRDIAPLSEDEENEIYDYGCLNTYFAGEAITSTGDLSVWNPRVDKLDGNEPSIDDILDNKFYPKNYWEKNDDVELLWDINQEEDKLSLTSLNTSNYGGVWYNFSNSNSPLKKNTEYQISLSISSYTGNWNLYLNQRQDGTLALPISGATTQITIGSDITTGDYSWTFITPDLDLLELDPGNTTYPTPISNYNLHLNSAIATQNEIIIDNISIKELSTTASDHNKLNVVTNENFISEYLGWRESSSHYSDYVLRNELSVSSITATITGTTYGNSTSGTEYTVVIPYLERLTNEFGTNSLLRPEDIAVLEELLTNASNFDNANANSVVNSIPTVVSEVNDELDSLLKIIGHGFDNFLIALNDYKKMYNFSYKMDEMPNITVLDALIKNMGFDNIVNNLNYNIIQKEIFFDGNSYSKTDLEKLIKMFFVNNIIYILKSKGTRESIRSFIRLLGWPENLISITEHMELAENISDLEYIYDELYFKKYPIYSNGEIKDISRTSAAGNNMIYHFGLSNVAGIKDGTCDDYEILSVDHIGSQDIKLSVSASISSLVVSYDTIPIYYTFPLTSNDWSLIDDYEPLCLMFTRVSNKNYISLSYVMPQMKLINSDNYTSLTAYNYRDNILNTTYEFVVSVDYNFMNLNLTCGDAAASSSLAHYALKFIDEPNITEFNSLSAGFIKNLDLLKWDATNNFSDIYMFRSYAAEVEGLEILNSIPLRDSLTSSSTGSIVLKDIQFIKQHKLSLNSGIMPSFEGIFIDDINNDFAENKIRANDLLKININPTDVINQFIDGVLAASYNIENLDAVYAKASDMYSGRWSELRTLKDRITLFLNTYEDSIDVNTFFDVVSKGYSNNIFTLIKNLLVPAKANLEFGLVVENDKLYDKKYAWKELENSQEVKTSTTEHGISHESEDVLLDGEVISEVNTDSNLFTDKADINLTIESTTGLALNLSSNFIYNINGSEGTNNYLANGEDDIYNVIRGEGLVINIDDGDATRLITFNTEYETYDNIYIDLNKWCLSKKIFQGNEKQMIELEYYYKYDGAEFVLFSTTASLSPRYGTNTWDSPSIKWNISADNIIENPAHKEYSKLVVNNDSNELLGISDENILEIGLDRFGFSLPYSNVNMTIPFGDVDLLEPAINILNLSADDISNNNATNITVKLDEYGRRTLTYKINDNINLSADETVIQANGSLNFGDSLGSSGDEEIIISIFASDSYEGEKGNGLKFGIEYDNNIAGYAISEVDKNKNVTVKVAEVPYTLWKIRDCLDNKQIDNVLNITSLKTSLDGIIDSGITADEYWQSYLLGEVYLKNGSGKNKQSNKVYKIKINNIYNLDDSIELPILFKEKSNIIDENITFEENQKNNK